MQNEIFLTKLDENQDNPQILTLVRELAFEFGKAKFSQIGMQNEAVVQVFSEICNMLKSKNLLNPSSAANVLDALADALTEPKEQNLYRLIYEKEQLEKRILAQSQEIKFSIQNALEAIENFIKTSDFENKEDILKATESAMILDIQVMSILKEIGETAFLSAVEKGEDVHDTSEEIAKNLVYSATSDEFARLKFIQVSKNLLTSAITVANEEHIHAKDLITGTVLGARAGIAKRIEKFRDEMKFAPDNQTLIAQAKGFVTIEEEFVRMLKELLEQSEQPAAGIIAQILESELDNYLAKFKRTQNEISDQLSLRLEELKMNENFDRLASVAGAKFDELRRELNETGDKIKENLVANKSIEALKAEIAELEKKAKEKLENIDYNEIGESVKSKAKELGNQIFDAAQNFIKTAKEKLNKKDE